MLNINLRGDVEHCHAFAFKKLLQIKLTPNRIGFVAIEIIRKQKLVENRKRFEQIVRPFGICRQHSAAVHELTMDGVGGFMSQNAKVVVRTGKARAVENAISPNKPLRESAALAMVTRDYIHTAIRRVEEGGQLAAIFRPERRQRRADYLARLINRVTRWLTSGRVLYPREVIRAQPLITLIDFCVLC